MVDPLGLAGAGGTHGVNGPDRSARPQGPNAPGSPQGAPSFKDVLLKNIEQVNELQQDSEAAVEDLMTGKRNDVEAVMLAAQKADTAFRTLLAVRNKVLEAYSEIQQMRV